MYVILISAYFFHKPIGMEFPHFLERFLEVFLDAVHEDFSSVSGDPHNVILRFVHCVGLAMELHASIVSWGSRMRLPAHTPTLTGGELPREKTFFRKCGNFSFNRLLVTLLSTST